MTVWCPGCETTRKAMSYGVKDNINLVVCHHCRLAFVDCDRQQKRKKEYYQKKHFREIPNYNLTHIDRLQFIQKFISGGKVLEFGGGRGETSLVAHSMGFEVCTLEENSLAVEFGKKYCPKIQWLQASCVPEHIPDNSFDLVISFHVLEHLPYPAEILRQFQRILKPGKYLCLEVPNWGSLSRKWRKMSWHYICDVHINYFDCGTLNDIVQKQGFVFCGLEYRKTFAINEKQMWKEPLKRILCKMGFADNIRGMWKKNAPAGSKI